MAPNTMNASVVDAPGPTDTNRRRSVTCRAAGDYGESLEEAF